MNNPLFQESLFNLEKVEQPALIRALRKISKLTWQQFYSDNGLNWEQILSRRSKEGKPLYTFRFSKKYRALAVRDKNCLKLISLHTDHDSAYK